MPIFDYKCPACSAVRKDVLIRAGDYSDIGVWCKCGASMFKMPAVPNMHLFPIGGIHLKHVCPGGRTFYSKNEMKQYAKKHDMDLGALL